MQPEIIKYIKRSVPLLLADVRKDILQNDIGISVDYYPAYSGVSNHCAWVCTDIDCEQCGNSFKSFPAFLKHLRIHHHIYFSIVKLEVTMRQKYHRIVTEV